MPNIYPENSEYGAIQFAKPISLKPEYKNERKAMRILPLEHPEQKYLSQEEQYQFEIQFSEDEEGFLDCDENPLSGLYNFVLTCDDPPRLLCHESLHHSYLANGKKVFAAGTLLFEFETLTSITNSSGHYRPDDNESLAIVKALFNLSQGSLKTYISFSGKQERLYPVQELVAVTDISEVQPLEFNETIDKVTGFRIAKPNFGYEQSTSEYGMANDNKRLFASVDLKYQNIIATYGLFGTAPQATNSIVSDETHMEHHLISGC